MMFSSLITLAIVPLAAMALPGRTPIPGLGAAAVFPMINIASCPISSSVISLPSNQTTLAVPSGVSPVAIALGIGVQNYTCAATSNYTSTGAIASLFDISCLVNTPTFARVQDDYFALPTGIQKAIVAAASKTPLLLAYHYFITNPVTGTGISPKFAQKANGGAIFTTLAKKGGVKAPNTANVDWLQLSSIQGDWASTVFRVDTKAGQPPASCTPGSPDISVPYAAKYWFYK